MRAQIARNHSPESDTEIRDESQENEKAIDDDWFKRHVIIARPDESVKHSKEGDVDTTIDNFVEDKDLTPQQKLLKSFGKKLGMQTKFFDNPDGKFHGAHAGNISYVNVNSNKPLGT